MIHAYTADCRCCRPDALRERAAVVLTHLVEAARLARDRVAGVGVISESELLDLLSDAERSMVDLTHHLAELSGP